MPGLFLTPKAGPFDYVTASLQGSRTNEILWLVDGVRISNRLYNGTTPLDTIPAHMVERIEVLEGGQGLFYGTQAVAGCRERRDESLYRTDATDDSRPAGIPTRAVFVSGLGRGTAHGNRFVLYASSDDAEGFEPFPAEQYQPSTTDRRRSYDVHTLGGKYAYDFSQQLRFSAAYQFTNGKLDLLQPARSSTASSRRPRDGVQRAQRAHLQHEARLHATPHGRIVLQRLRASMGLALQRDAQRLAAPSSETTISDHEFWGYKDYGANLLAKLTPIARRRIFCRLRFSELLG